jgi:hypothetical protein
VREKRQLPLVVVDTQAHYDHFLRQRRVHRGRGYRVLDALELRGRNRPARGQRHFVVTLEPEMSTGEGDKVELAVPNAIVKDQPVLVDPPQACHHTLFLGPGPYRR